MKMKMDLKRLLSVVLCIALGLTLCGTALAEGTDAAEPSAAVSTEPAENTEEAQESAESMEPEESAGPAASEEPKPEESAGAEPEEAAAPVQPAPRMAMAPAAGGDTVTDAKTFTFKPGTTNEELAAAWGEGAASIADNGDGTYTVTLLKNIEMGKSQNINFGEFSLGAGQARMILDLNGKTITGTSIVIANLGNLTITGNGSVIYDGGQYLAAVNNAGYNLTIESGTFTCNGAGSASYNAAVSTAAGVTTVINGGTFNGGSAGAVISYGDTVINGGTLNGKYGVIAKVNSSGTEAGSITLPEGSSAVVNAESAPFVAHGSNGKAGSITVAGGTTTGSSLLGTMGTVDDKKAVLTVTGGKHEADPSDYIPEDMCVVVNPDGTFTVGEYAAQVGDQKYATVQEAINDAQPNSTVEIIAQEAVTEELTISKNLTIAGQGKDTTVLKGKITVYGCTAELKDLRVENNTATAYGTALITFPAAQAAADVTFTNCTVYDNDTAFRLESEGSSLTLDHTDVTGAAHYGVGLRNENQTLTVNGGSITGWGAVMTSAGSLPDGTEDSGTKIEISGAKIVATEGASGGYYGAIVLQESYHGVELTIRDSEVIGEGLHTAALDIRAYGSTIMVENSTLRADSLIYGTPDGETGQPGYYGPVTLSHNATYEKVYTTAADAPETAVILDAATNVECKPMSEGGTYPIIKRGQDTATIGGTTYDVVAGGSISEAIAAAEDGATLRIQAGTYTEPVKPQAGDSQHVKEKSITLLGANAENDPNSSAWLSEETVLTGGMYLGYDDSHTRNYSITVKGITFQGKGLTIADEKDVVIENNKFTDITDANAIAVLDQECDGMKGSVIVKNNRIVGVTHASGMGINLRNPYDALVTGNYIENTNHNAILFQKNSGYDRHAGKVEITGNTIVNWDADNDASGGRAIRIDTQGNGSGDDTGKEFVITGNSMQKPDYDPATATDPDFAKITGVGENEVDLCGNYWNSEKPDFDTIIAVYKDGSTVCPNVSYNTYYTDKDLTKLIVEADGIVLNQTTATAEIGKTIQLTAAVTPENATDKTVKWSSSNDTAADVDQNGLVTAKTAGQAVITAENSAGDTAECIVTVTEQQVKAVTYTDAATGVTLNTDTTKAPEGSYLLVKPVAETEQAHADAKEALKDKAGRFVLYDITLVNAAGEPIQPAGDVLIGIPTPDGYDTSKLAVHRINEDKTTVEHGVAVQDGVSYFQTDHFSKYALIEKGSMSGAGTDDTAKDEGADSSDTPKTGDTADMTPYILLAVIAGAAAAAAVTVTMRKRRQYEK